MSMSYTFHNLVFLINQLCLMKKSFNKVTENWDTITKTKRLLRKKVHTKATSGFYEN